MEGKVNGDNMTIWIDEQRYKILIYAVSQAIEIMKSGRIEKARNILEAALIETSKTTIHQMPNNVK